jgi:hypothetical protein
VPNGLYTFGNGGRNLISGPGITNLDFAIYKIFRMAERIGLQFRLEAFNSTNSPPFNPPNVQVGDPAFGIISAAGTPKNLQFGLKVIF